MNQHSSLLVIQLSDLHFSTKSDTAEIQRRAEQLVRSSLIGVNSKNILFIISGDIAYSGKQEEYEVAEIFITTILVEAEKLSSTTKVQLVVAPGNHDVDHSSNSELHDFVRQKQDKTSIASALKTQELFATLQSGFTRFENSVDSIAIDTKSVYVKNAFLVVADVKIQIRVLNSALFSAKNERPGTLYLPPSTYDDGWEDNTFRIAVLHHPYSWFDETCKRNIRQGLTRCAHLIFFGHEHKAEVNGITQLSVGELSDDAWEVYGDVLFDSQEIDRSSFSSVYIDFAMSTAVIRKFDWDHGNKLYKAVGEDKKSIATKLKLPTKSQPTAFTPDFVKLISNPGFEISSLSGRRIRSSDLYIQRDIEHVTEHKSSSVIYRSEEFIDPKTVVSQRSSEESHLI